MVVDNSHQEFVLAIKKQSACLKTSDVAGFLTAIHGIGPYLATHVIATMLSKWRLSYDVGIVGPGSLATVTYLCGGDLEVIGHTADLHGQEQRPWNYSPSGSARGMPLVGHAMCLVCLAFFTRLP